MPPRTCPRRSVFAPRHPHHARPLRPHQRVPHRLEPPRHPRLFHPGDVLRTLEMRQQGPGAQDPHHARLPARPVRHPRRTFLRLARHARRRVHVCRPRPQDRVRDRPRLRLQPREIQAQRLRPARAGDQLRPRQAPRLGASDHAQTPHCGPAGPPRQSRCHGGAGRAPVPEHAQPGLRAPQPGVQ